MPSTNFRDEPLAFSTDIKTKSDNTRYRLLFSACRIFAEKGFQETTIAEICEQAKTNIASVNYHFRDKETLYLEAWRFAFNRELTLYPPDSGVTDDTSADQQLAARIRSLIMRISDENAYSFAIVYKEMAQPTRLQAILENELKPQRQQLLFLLKKCLGSKVSDQQIQFCHASIMGQCFQLLCFKHLQKTKTYLGNSSELNDIKAFTEHVVQFSLAGISAIRSQTF